MLLILLLLFSNCALGSLTRVANTLQFKGFIYPYAVYLQTPANSVQKIILFQKVSSKQIYPNLTQLDLKHLEGYRHLESFAIPGDFSIEPSIIVKDNTFVLREEGVNETVITTYLKNPHQHKYYEYHNLSDSPKRFLNFFKLQEVRSDDRRQQRYFYQVSELWRSWVFVEYFQDIGGSDGGKESNGQFKLKLRRQPSNTITSKTFVFIKEYFSTGQVLDIILQKHPWRLLLTLLVISQYKICVFQINNQLNLNFKYCEQKKDKIKQVTLLKNNNIAIFYQQIEGQQLTLLNKFEIQTLQQQNKVSCSVTLPQPKEGRYHIQKVIRNRLVFCSVSECHSYNFRCESHYGVEQQMLKVDNIYYERIEHPYLQFVYSMVVIESGEEVASFVECDEPRHLIPYLKLCQKPEMKNNSFITDKLVNMTCSECSVFPKAYFVNSTCTFIPNHQIQYFEESVYINKEVFLLHYAKYLSGISNTCEPRLQCDLRSSYAYSYVSVFQSDDLPTNSTCEVLLPVHTYSDHVIETLINSQFSIKLCISQTKESQLSCIHQNSPYNRKRFMVKAKNYILIVFTANARGRKYAEFQITNLEEEKTYRVTLLLKRIVLSILSIVTIVLVVALVKNRVIAQLTSWGWIQYIPSGNYPLLQSQLKLKIKHNLQRGYIKKYPYHILKNPNRKDDQSVEKKQCVICLGEFNENQEIFEIYCRHQFHCECLSEWFQKEASSDKCPICKREFELSRIMEFNSGNYQFNKKLFQSSQSLELGI